MATRRRITAALVLLAAGTAVQGGEWDLSASLGGRLTWTDNVRLSSTGEESAGVLEIAPRFSAQRAGARLRVRADYRLQQYLYTESLDAASTYHQFQGDAKATLVPESLFLDASARYSQVLVDPDEAVPAGNLALSGNRANVGTFSASPYALFRLGDFATGQVRYSYRGVRASRGGADSDGTSVSASLASRQRSDRIGWALRWSHSDQRYDTRPTFEREVASADLRIPVTPRLSLVGTGGREDNSYQRAAGSRLPEGTFWSAGVYWVPTRRTSVELRTGRRFFGRTALADVRYRLRRVVLTASYLEDLATFQRVVLERQVFLITDPFGNPILDPATGNPILIEIAYPALSAEVYLRRRGQVSWTWRRGRSTYALSAYHERREYQTTLEKERLRGGRVSWNWRMARRTTWTLTGLLQRRDVRGGTGEDEYRLVDLTIRRTLRPDLKGSLSLRRVVRDGTGGVRNYDQNVVTLGVTATF